MWLNQRIKIVTKFFGGGRSHHRLFPLDPPLPQVRYEDLLIALRSTNTGKGLVTLNLGEALLTVDAFAVNLVLNRGNLVSGTGEVFRSLSSRLEIWKYRPIFGSELVND